MYLLKYLAHCGICSRRKAADIIKRGFVSVNGSAVTMPFSLVSDDDVVTYKGEVVRPEAYVYLMLNKPKGYLTTCDDEKGRKTVMELIKGATKKRVYPVGRLDRMSTGVLFFTNDGALAQKLSHPRGNVAKQYRVFLDRSFAKRDRDALLNGFELRDLPAESQRAKAGSVRADRCIYGESGSKRDVIVEIHSGQNHIVRRLFKHLGYSVEKLDRVSYAGLITGKLPRGEWRFLTAKEVRALKSSW